MSESFGVGRRRIRLVGRFDHRGIQLFECRSWIGGDSAEAETSVMMEGSVGDFTFQQYLAIKSMFVHLNNAAATIHHNSEKMK